MDSTHIIGLLFIIIILLIVFDYCKNKKRNNVENFQTVTTDNIEQEIMDNITALKKKGMN